MARRLRKRIVLRVLAGLRIARGRLGLRRDGWLQGGAVALLDPDEVPGRLDRFAIVHPGQDVLDEIARPRAVAFPGVQSRQVHDDVDPGGEQWPRRLQQGDRRAGVSAPFDQDPGVFDIGLGESRPQLDRFPEHLPGAYQVGREAVRAVERVGRRPPRQALAEVKAGRGIIRVEHHGPVVHRDRLVIALGHTGQMGQPRVGRRIVRREPLRFVKMLRGFGAAILIEVRQQIPQPKENLLLLHGCDLRDIVDRQIRKIEGGVQEARLAHVAAQFILEGLIGRLEAGGERRVRILPAAEALEEAEKLRLPLRLVPHQVMHQRPGLGVEHAAPLPLVVVRGARRDREQLAQRKQGVVPQEEDMVGLRQTNRRRLVVSPERAVALRQPLVEPGRHTVQVVLEEMVRVFVEDDLERVGMPFTVQDDVVAVRTTHEQTAQLDRPTVEALLVRGEGGVVLEDVDEGGDGGIDPELVVEARQRATKPLESASEVESPLVGGVAVEDEVRGLDLDPAVGLWRKRGRARVSGRDTQQDRGKSHGHSRPGVLSHDVLACWRLELFYDEPVPLRPSACVVPGGEPRAAVVVRTRSSGVL